MTTAALVRCIEIDDEALRLAAQLRPVFGADIWFLQDRYGATDLPPLSIEGQAIRVSQAWLTQHGYPHFPRVGWQCGDYMFYAGAEALPQHDRFWLIEPDVFLNLDVTAFFGQLEALDADFLGSNLRKTSSAGVWYRSGLGLAPEVYKSLFPIGRLSRRAIDHLRAERSRYAARPDITALDLQRRERSLFANDEVFVSTVLMRDGFSCLSMRDLMPKAFKGGFTTRIPILEIDIDRYPDRVLHPVCDPVRARRKLRNWASTPKDLPEFLKFREQVIARHGAETWALYCDVDLP